MPGCEGKGGRGGRGRPPADSVALVPLGVGGESRRALTAFTTGLDEAKAGP